MQQLNTKTRKNRFFHFLLLFAYFSFTAKAIAIENSETATLQINFPGLKSVHTDIRLSDGIADSATGTSIKKSNWKNNSTTVEVPQGHYDLIIKKGAGTLIVDDVDCSSNSCTVNNLTATMTVNFPGMSSVHTSVFVADNIADNTSNQKVTHRNWQKDQAVITVLRQKYDLRIQKGSDVIILDEIDCLSGVCLVDNITAKMIVNFPGLNAVHTSAYAVDGIDNTVTGTKSFYKNWQTNQAVLTVFKKQYDVSIHRKNSLPLIRDNVDCSTGECKVDNLISTLTVKFPGMSSIHTSVRQPDNQPGNASGKEFAHKNWQKSQATMTVLRQKYDIQIKRNNSAPVTIDNIDCTSGSCIIDQITATLTVKFPAMRSVHTSVFVPDDVPGKAEGAVAFKRNWQNNQAVLTVFRQTYDVGVRKGESGLMVVDNVDCTTGTCTVDQITATMTVKFPGIRGVHTSVHVPDQQAGSADGAKVTKLNWQTNQAKIPVFKQIYDVSIRQNQSEPMIIDAVDCRSGNCKVDQITATLTVDFPKLRHVHTSVRIPDNIDGKADGNQVTKLNWQTDKAVLTVFRQIYDVRVKKESVTKILDNINCTSGICAIKELTATLSIDFPGLRNVHSSAHKPDSIDNEANGEKAAKSNWKTNNTTITLLRETYDVKVQHGIDSIFDNVDCNNASCKVLITGNVQAYLIDGDSKKPISDQYLTAYEKTSAGTLKRVMKGRTTDQGQVNFTLPGISSGKIYVFKVYSPFGNGKTYFSSFITNEGEHKFIVTVDGENSLDLTPPEVTISSPQNNSSVPHLGFKVTGTATDNRKIDRVELTIDDPIKGTNIITRSYDENTHIWTADVPATAISLNNTIKITATTFDLAQNQSTASVTVSVVEDTQGPETIITSHVDNDEVPVTGFLLSGTVTDLTGVATLQATLVDSTLDTTMSNQNLDFSINNGTWTLVINNGLMTEGGAVDISFNAVDTIGNTSSKTIHLLVVAVDYSNTHMINRITFGTTPTLIQEVTSSGALPFLEQQLSPASIDDSEFTAVMGNLPNNKDELQAWTLRHMAFSKRQLLEVMTWFWDNHFNTNINTERNNAQNVKLSNTVQYELAENQAFRSNALGNFRDLLEISAKSPAMLIYLDSISNVAGDSNENYAREVDELHTLGVNGGYTAQDVENGAEIFTGWHVQNGAFFFDASLHTVGSYTMFQGTPQQVDIPEGGEIQGEQLLDALATHPSTATFICTKLVTLFVDDTPPSSLVTRCTSEFLSFSAENNQIERVIRLIMQSAEFNDPAHYRSKIKTPIEFVIGAIRNIEATSDASDLVSPIRTMGIRLYENPVPTGWSEIGADWINASLLIERMKWINSFVRNVDTNNSASDPMQFYPSNGFETADGIVGFLLQLTVGDDFTPLARANALETLGSGFDLSNQNAETKLRLLNGSVMSYPQYQFQ